MPTKHARSKDNSNSDNALDQKYTRGCVLEPTNGEKQASTSKPCCSCHGRAFVPNSPDYKCRDVHGIWKKKLSVSCKPGEHEPEAGRHERCKGTRMTAAVDFDEYRRDGNTNPCCPPPRTQELTEIRILWQEKLPFQQKTASDVASTQG